MLLPLSLSLSLSLFLPFLIPRPAVVAPDGRVVAKRPCPLRQEYSRPERDLRGSATMEAAAPAPDPALWIAARKGRKQVVMQLLQNGADIEETGGRFLDRGDAIFFQSSPLWEAASNGRDGVVLLLLENGADVSATCDESQEEDDGGNDNVTPLMAATRQGHPEVMGILLEHGADVNAQDGWDFTALHYVFQGAGDYGMAQMLVHAGADVSARDVNGRTPLHAAAEGYETTMVALLLTNGAEADALTQDADGNTAEDLAALKGHTEIAAMLTEVRMIKNCEAFAMGHQERLGEGSRVRALDAGVVQMVLEHV